jgi:predicted ABC-type ATPase
MSRVADRVKEGGHNILNEVIERRYYRGIANLIKLYIQVCDNWIIFDNTNAISEVVAHGGLSLETSIKNDYIWSRIVRQSNYP